MSTTATSVSKISTVIVPVSDQERALGFYVGALGLEKRGDTAFGNGYRWIEVAPAGAETTIAIAPPPEGKPTGDVQTGISLYTEDVDGYHASLKEHGVDVDPEVTRMGGPIPPMFWVRDPDRNSLIVVGAV